MGFDPHLYWPEDARGLLNELKALASKHKPPISVSKYVLTVLKNHVAGFDNGQLRFDDMPLEITSNKPKMRGLSTHVFKMDLAYLIEQKGLDISEALKDIQEIHNLNDKDIDALLTASGFERVKS